MLSGQAASQTVDHWETVVYDSMVWRYWPGSSNPGTNWNTPTFNDQLWQQGRGGIGYGDNDDRTLIDPVLSVFLRKKFTITNRAKILDAMLHVDYDDGFIVYLNGVEIARANMGTNSTVAFNQGSSGLHEALLYQGFTPEGYLLKSELLDGLLVAGENTLSVQVHNDNISSSDLSSSVFFSVAVADNSFTYLQTPSWFVEPLNFTSSNLPIIVINTNGGTIVDEPRIVANMGIVDNGPGNRNHLADVFNNYNGKISIEIRGESSQSLFPKKSFRLETQDALGNNLNVALLGMPPENDWVLYAPYSDKTMIRNVITYELGNKLGNYAPRTRLAELVINDVYQGIYVLIEKIKRDKNRVDISTLTPTDISGDELTGGYLLRVDKFDGNDFPGWTATPVPTISGENNITFQYDDPAGDKLVNAQTTYIRNYMQTFQSSLTSLNFTNDQSGFKKYLDIPAALNFMIVNEVSKNIDGYIFSTYLYKDKNSRGGLLTLGPLWDFNLAFGNVNYLPNAQFAPGWMWDDQYRMFWFRRMMQDPSFANKMKCRWTELRSGFLTNEYFTNKIDSLSNVLGEAQVRNFQRWPTLGRYVWPNQFIGLTYQDEINFLKQWIIERLTWMDSNMPGTCSLITSVETRQNQIQVYPNPFGESIEIVVESASELIQLKVFDLVGRQVFQTHFANGTYQWIGIDGSGRNVPAGIYIIQLSNTQGLLGQQKIIKSY